jgi:hypothetical protein
LAVDLEERFLHDVAGVHLALDPPADLHARQERQVIRVRLQKAAQRRLVAALGLEQESLWVVVLRHAPRSGDTTESEVMISGSEILR